MARIASWCNLEGVCEKTTYRDQKKHMTSFNYDLDIQTKFLDFKKIDKEYSNSILKNVFFINKKLLIENSKQEEFLHKYNMNPRLVSLDYYNNQNFYNIILTANNLYSVFNFNHTFFEKKKLIIPNLSTIRKLIQYVN